MTIDEKPKKRMGRPPRDPMATGRASFHVGLRLADVRRDQLLRLVEAANERARASGIPPNVTPSSLITHWVLERLDAEIAKLDRRKR